MTTLAKKLPPARTVEGRQGQLINMAMDLVEKRMANGIATAQEVTHFLKLGTTTHRTEEEILQRQRDLLIEKTETLRAQKREDSLFEEAIAAMRTYSGQGNDEGYDPRDYRD